MRGIFQKLIKGLITNQAIYSAFSIEMYRNIVCRSSRA